MFTEGYSFPHPVLGNADDIQGELNISLDVQRRADRKIVFENATVEITNPYLKELVEANKALCTLRIYCSSTLRTWVFPMPQQIEINEDDLINKAELQILIVASEAIGNFRDASFHPQYANSNFSINRNDVIGISGKVTVTIPKVDEKLGLGNIFKFYPNDTSVPIRIEPNHDKIYIYYPVTAKNEHPPNVLFSRKPWTAFSIYIVPALAEALRYIEVKPGEADGWEWYTVIDDLHPEEDRLGEYYPEAQTIIQSQLPVLLAYDELTK